MACVYKYNDQWLSEEEVLKVLSERKEFKSLYQNLLKELESGKGEEILNRVKRDYVRKFSTFNYESLQQEEKENIYYNWYYDWIASFENEDENEDEDEREYQYPSNAEIEAAFNKYIEDKSFSGEYTLEEQQEEAIVELMSLMVAEKLNAITDKNLISLLKQLLKEMKQFIRALLSQREVEIDKLPTSMTINDLSDLLAYSNNKLILPGYEVEYTTPDNMKFKTYQEASNYISELSKNIKDVDLDNVSIDSKLTEDELEEIAKIEKLKNDIKKELISEEYIENKNYHLSLLNEELAHLEKIIIYSDEPFINFSIKGFEDFAYLKLENTYNRNIDLYKDVLGENYEGYYLHGYNPYYRDEKEKILPITDEKAEEILDNRAISNYAEDLDTEISLIKDEIYDLETDEKMMIELRYLEEEINIIKSKQNTIKNFIIENTQYAKSKEIIEEWKRVNDIQYNPEEVYSRNRKFYHKVGAYITSFDPVLMMQNYMAYLEDYERIGAELVINGFTRTKNNRVSFESNNIETSSDLRIVIYPTSEDIKWVTSKDAMSGTTRQNGRNVSEIFGVKNPEIAGIGETKAPTLDNLRFLKPSIAEAIESEERNSTVYKGTYNEIGLKLTGTNFRFEYDKNTPYQQKKMADKLNALLDSKFGKIKEPDIYNNPIQPTITKKTLKESIESIEDKVLYTYLHSFIEDDVDLTDENGNPSYYDFEIVKIEDDKYRVNAKRKLTEEEMKDKFYEEDWDNGYAIATFGRFDTIYEARAYLSSNFNYTEQALINAKLVALKQAGRKYHRSLIRSEVKKIEDTTSSYEDYEDDIFQKLPSVSPSTDEIKYNDKGEVLAPNGEVSILYKDIELLVEEQNKEQGNLRENIIDIANNSKWEHNRRLASFLLDSNFGINSFFKFVGDSMYDDLLKLGGWGLYYKDDNGVKQINIYSVLINKYFENDIERQKYYEEEVILHETVHLIVHEGLNANEDIENKLIDLMDFVKTKIDTSKYSNAFKNVQEFVAEAFTNAKFQVELKKIKYKGKLTIWNKFIELINIMAKSLGINTEYSVLEEIVSLTDILFNENKQLSLQLYKQTRSKEFKEWFGDSKVVDKNGEPLVVYHGANSEFDIFNKGNIFFTDNKEYARGFAENNVHDKIIEGLDYDVIVMPAFLRLVNPKNVDYKIHHITLNEDKFDGYDGIIGKEAVEYDINDYIAFEPKQIKSVFNQGTFSKENDNIDYYEKLPSTSPFEEFQKSLNKPDTNPVLLNNKEEQDKKFKELQEKLQDETFLEAVKSVFDNSSKLQQFAYETFLPDEDTSMKLSSKEEVLSLYTDYVAKIALGIIKNPSSGEYNDSKVTDILHHGVTRGEVKDFDKFSDINQSSGTWGKGYYFAPTSNKFFVNAPIEKYVIVNSKKVITEKEHKTLFEEYKKRGFQGTVGLADTDNMFKEVREKYDTIDARERELIVFNPNQIHILGSKQDIEGFEKYIFNKSKQSPVEVLDNTEEIAEADNSPVSITPKKEVIQLPKTAQLILPIGISGSGKSTWINSLDKDKYTIISPDMIRKELTGDVSDNSRNPEIFKIVDDRILEALKKGDKVILDATNLNTTFRRLMITNLKSLYPILDIRYKLLDVDPEIAKQRIANDISNKVDRSKTPDEIIDLQYQQYLQSKLDIKDEPIYEFNNERTAITDLLDRYSKNDNSLRKLTNIAAISGKTQNISNVPIVKDTDNINENIITMAKYGRTVRELLAIYPSLTEHFKGINLDTKLSDYIKQQEIEKQVTDYVEAIKQDMADNFSDYEDYLSKIDVYTIDDLYNYPNEKLLNDLCINGNLSK